MALRTELPLFLTLSKGIVVWSFDVIDEGQLLDNDEEKATVSYASSPNLRTS